MGGPTSGAGGTMKVGKVNDVVEDANWRQRINAETEAASVWRHEWGFLLSQNGEEAGLSNTFTERARTKMKEMEAAQAGRDEETASAAKEKAEELFLKTFKKKHKEFPRCAAAGTARPRAHDPPANTPPARGVGDSRARPRRLDPPPGPSRRSSRRSRCSPPTSTGGTAARSSASAGSPASSAEGALRRRRSRKVYNVDVTTQS